jgi:hypothetical protein
MLTRFKNVNYIEGNPMSKGALNNPPASGAPPSMKGVPIQDTFCGRLMPLSFPTAIRFLDKAPLYQRGAAGGSGDFIQAGRPSASAKPPPGVAQSAGGEKTFTIPSSPFVFIMKPHNKRTKEEAYCQSQNRMK